MNKKRFSLNDITFVLQKIGRDFGEGYRDVATMHDFMLVENVLTKANMSFYKKMREEKDNDDEDEEEVIVNWLHYFDEEQYE